MRRQKRRHRSLLFQFGSNPVCISLYLRQPLSAEVQWFLLFVALVVMILIGNAYCSAAAHPPGKSSLLATKQHHSSRNPGLMLCVATVKTAKFFIVSKTCLTLRISENWYHSYRFLYKKLAVRKIIQQFLRKRRRTMTHCIVAFLRLSSGENLTRQGQKKNYH